MEKQSITRKVQSFALLCSMFIMAFLFALTDAREAKATSKGYKSNQCTLQSVTIEVDGKEYVCDGNLKYIPVKYDADWKELLKKIKITDYQVLVNDCCSHAKGHDSVEAGLYEEMGDCEYDYTKFLTYEDGGENVYTDLTESMEGVEYRVKFCLDGNCDTGIVTTYKKECPITYDLDGGSFPEGLDVPYVCGAGETVNLVSPVKSGSKFEEWQIEKNPGDYYSCDTEYCWDGSEEPPVFKAYWNGEEAPIDIGTYEIGVRSEVEICEGGVTTAVMVSKNGRSLTEGKDYYLSYKNNDKIAAADSENPPTVTITGIGEYTGTVDKTFTIVKNDLNFLQNYHNLHCSLRIAKGKPLSSIDLSSIHVMDSYLHEVKGTFSWTNEEYVPEGEVGACLSNDPNREEKTYELIFTPDNQEIYSTASCSSIEIYVYQGSIADCQITFASGKQSYLYTGKSIKPAVIVKDGETVLEEGDDYELSYAGYINVAGSTDKYAPTVTIKGLGNYLGTQKVTYTISMSPEAPVLTAVNETIKGKNDGSITGLTTDMEYRMALPSVGENTAAFTPVTDATMTFPAGDYEVRYAAKGIYAPSPVTTVTIQEGKALTVTLPAEQTGYTLTATANELSWQGTTTLTLTVAPGYTKTKDFALEANVSLVDNQDGTYTISGVTKDVTVTVKGIAAVTAPTASPTVTAAPSPTASPVVTETPSPTASPTVTETPSPTASPVVTAVPSPTASPVETATSTPTATPIIQPTSTPENKQDVTNLSAGTKIKDKEQKAHYVIREEKEGAVEIQYVAPVKKTAKVTIPKTVTLENGTVAKVTSIAPNAFKNNTTLQQITIADTVTTIGKNAFSGCKKLKKITIGKKVTSIGSNAFKNCKNIKTIVITSKKLKNLSKSAFKGITSKTTIKVPASMYKAYKKLLRKCGLKSSVKIKK